MVWIPYEGQNKIKPKSVVRLKECPNCGCPASECEKVSLDETSTSISFFKTDWAHKLYECGALFWDTLTKRYSKFNGRASRLEYWSFVFVSWWFIATTWGLGAIVVVIPALAVGVRRCHDINRIYKEVDAIDKQLAQDGLIGFWDFGFWDMAQDEVIMNISLNEVYNIEDNEAMAKVTFRFTSGGDTETKNEEIKVILENGKWVLDDVHGYKKQMQEFVEENEEAQQ